MWNDWLTAIGQIDHFPPKTLVNTQKLTQHQNPEHGRVGEKYVKKTNCLYALIEIPGQIWAIRKRYFWKINFQLKQYYHWKMFNDNVQVCNSHSSLEYSSTCPMQGYRFLHFGSDILTSTLPRAFPQDIDPHICGTELINCETPTD